MLPQYIGRARQTKILMLDGNQVTADTIKRTMEYDAFGRITHNQGGHHLFGFDNFQYTHDYADNILSELRSHKVNTLPFKNITTTSEVDHRSRLTNVYHQVSGLSQQHLCNNQYDHEDQLIVKGMGGLGSNNYLQTVNYGYLSNGFLEHINPTLASDDLFKLELNYTNTNTNLNAPAQYDGNIAQLSWQVQGSSEKTYGFDYDFLNRLSQSTYGTYSAGRASLAVGKEYDTEYYYDERGNIDSLKREGKRPEGNFSEIDDLKYEYYLGSNRLMTVEDHADLVTVNLPTNLTLSGPIPSGNYQATQRITANGQTSQGGNVNFEAGQGIKLTSNFKGKTKFSAQVTNVSGNTQSSENGGFVQNSTNNYEYDANGNMTRDPHKGITIAYNYLNLPYEISFDSGQKITWLYDANGTKWQKLTSQDGTTPLLTQDYISGVEYQNDTLEAIYHAEGRLYYEGSTSRYEYCLKDHLGNTRIMFADKDGNGSIDANTEILQENHYYPFGLAQEGSWLDNTSNPNDYLYNGKELDTDFGLNWYHYGARMYDPTIGRFTGVDPISDKFAELSTYNYASNNPISNIDLHGLQGIDINDPMPSAAGILYEAYQNARAGLFNLQMRHVENTNGFWRPQKGSIVTRMQVNYDADGFIPTDNPVSIVKVPRGSGLEEFGSSVLDALSLSPIAELGAAKGASGVFMAARTPSSIIPAIAKQFENFQCVECAGAIMDALKAEGISGEIVSLQARGRMDTRAGNVWSDTAGKTISTNGHHRGVLVDGKSMTKILSNIVWKDWNLNYWIIRA